MPPERVIKFMRSVMSQSEDIPSASQRAIVWTSAVCLLVEAESMPISRDLERIRGMWPVFQRLVIRHNLLRGFQNDPLFKVELMIFLDIDPTRPDPSFEKLFKAAPPVQMESYEWWGPSEFFKIMYDRADRLRGKLDQHYVRASAQFLGEQFKLSPKQRNQKRIHEVWMELQRILLRSGLMRDFRDLPELIHQLNQFVDME